MKVLVINGSPKGRHGITSQLAASFVKGLEAKGAVVTTLYTKEMKIGPCCGSFHCWTKEPGVCCKKDDMGKVLDLMNKTDILVLASPVYVDAITSPLKNILDRGIPRSLPFFELEDGHCRHPLRKGVNAIKQVVLISNCGFWEMDNFDPLISHMKAACKNLHAKFAGALLRPHGPALNVCEKFAKAKVLSVLQAAEQAGMELVETGEMSEKALAGVSAELIPQKLYLQVCNAFFGTQITIGKVKEFVKLARKEFSFSGAAQVSSTST